MLDELKSKLGFGGDAARGRSNDRYDDYDDYGDYEDDYSEYAEYADDYADDSGNDYDPYAPVTTRSARSNSTISNLVSINDVRAHARGEGSSSTTSTSARRMTTAHTPYRGERTTVDSSLPPTMTPEGSAAVAAAASRPTRSEGLNSLFEPTASEAKETLDAFAEAVAKILEEAAEDPSIARAAPYDTPVRRLDEAAAAKRPVIRQPL